MQYVGVYRYLQQQYLLLEETRLLKTEIQPACMSLTFLWIFKHRA